MKKQKGFTFIDFLVVVAGISLIIALVSPVFKAKIGTRPESGIVAGDLVGYKTSSTFEGWEGEVDRGGQDRWNFRIYGKDEGVRRADIYLGQSLLANVGKRYRFTYFVVSSGWCSCGATIVTKAEPL
jgi:hypothetical protein